MPAKILQFISRAKQVRRRRGAELRPQKTHSGTDWWKYRHARDLEEGLLAWVRLMQRGELPLPGRPLPQESETENAPSPDERKR